MGTVQEHFPELTEEILRDTLKISRGQAQRLLKAARADVATILRLQNEPWVVPQTQDLPEYDPDSRTLTYKKRRWKTPDWDVTDSTDVEVVLMDWFSYAWYHIQRNKSPWWDFEYSNNDMTRSRRAHARLKKLLGDDFESFAERLKDTSPPGSKLRQSSPRLVTILERRRQEELEGKGKYDFEIPDY